MNEESEQEARLRAVAGQVTARPDVAEVELGAARRRSRRRAGTALIAAMLVAGAGGVGFGLGRAATDDNDEALVAPAGQPRPASEVSPTAAPPVPVTSPPPTVAMAEGTVAAAQGASEAAVTDAGVGWSPLGEYELVQARTLDGGYDLRVLLGPQWEEDMPPDPNGWQPAAFCWGTRELRIGVAGPGVIDVTSTSWNSELFKGLGLTSTFGGWADRRPYRIVTVQATPDATEVSVTWPDGAVDRVPFEDGLAVAFSWGAVTDGPPEFTAGISMADGTVREVNEQDVYPSDDPDWRAACEPPPPELPPPGEQPSDPGGAEAEIRENLRILFDISIPPEEKPDGLLDDDTGVTEARAAVEDGPYADVAATAVHVIEELVFTSPTEAWFRYGIDSDNGYFGNRFGIATLIDGRWRIARAVVCQDVALAGAMCDPPAEQIFPPGLEPMYEELSEPMATTIPE